ncbi:MAG TPA: Asp-tRNA(Asn)/Glu-tRNA(Gln) amidotransferase subunit GatC [Brevibacterium senegalense]|jgi:aspartyl-tRNA(Asn)/glutamyl-tRNA(Gln) amidotransferase subunit C|uniref:Aspartyl/glutamyl-tRNA(Asn/Gln) amidotransferase subunit C n=1 Tax=Brevibacterium senegalense TaxID=1033736 RepID=A0A921MEY2_9MICO|nr:Asp-tRNA(Asn)/Glu-tRNA(Gln) amidotransferase subunit GatC [Brevibacterium senegalense]HJG80716.1 Asp-tRNA(Asn)/Glu-tRNA(Gln) amidotransferase subunit GatC [Brevibacterium senegalense]
MADAAAITAGQVEHLAELARIAMTSDELEKTAEDLGRILSSVARVTEVATDDVPATSHPMPLTNVLREDVVGTPLTAEQALSGAPAAEDGKFLVPQILGED